MNIENSQKTYKTDKLVVYSCQYHVIFTPKYRRCLLTNGVDTRLKELVFSKQEDYNYKIIEIEVMPDHVHMLVDVSPKINIHNLIVKIKGFLAHELRAEFPDLKSKLPSLWTRSYFISSVGTQSLEVIKQYIENQKSN
jgi:putative transposase